MIPNSSQKRSSRIKFKVLKVRHCVFQMWWSSTPTGFWATLWGTRYGWSPSAIISTSHSWATTVGSRCFPFQHPTLMKSKLIRTFSEQIDASLSLKCKILLFLSTSFLQHYPSCRTQWRCSTPSLCSSSSMFSPSPWVGTLPRGSAGFTSTECSRASCVGLL